MKKLRFIPLVLIVVLLFSVLAGCANKGEDEKIVLGIYDIAGVAETMETMFPGVYEVHTFPTTNEILAALKSGRIDEALQLKPCAEYFMKGDDTLQFEQGPISPSPTMLTRAEDEDLLAAVNSAIETLKANGRLDELYTQYVENASPDSIPEAPAIETIEGARTVIVGVTGDLPPYDYVSTTGTPSGYNVALMGEIAKLAGFNVQFENLNFSTKFSALKSERIDLFFLHMGFISDKEVAQTIAIEEEVPAGKITLK